MDQYFALGRSRMIDAIRGGEGLHRVLTGLSTTRTTAVGASLYSGAISCLVGAFCAVRGAGYTLKTADSEITELLCWSNARIQTELAQGFNGGDLKRAADLLGAMCDVVGQLREHLCWPEPGQPAPPTEQTLNVRIVSMPDRTTTTTVDRDPDTLQIIGSEQHQADSAD